MIHSVSAILDEQHGLTARPGVKVECPFCHHNTLSIKRDDSLAKCFYPSCGRFITPSHDDQQYANSLYRVLEDIFHDFHASLLDQKNVGDQWNAYTYLTKERGIHPGVIADAPLGVVPSGYDLASKFAPLIEEAESAIKAEEEDRKGEKGRPKKATGFTLEQRLQFLTESQEKLFKCVHGHAGWLCFFYTDATHRIVAIRFREPYAKRIVYFKPFRKVAGLFGHGMFTPYQCEDLRDLNDFLIITEGEFNQLQLQSLCLRYGEATGKETGYLFACAVGAVTHADYTAIKKIAHRPVICYDNDVSGAGLKLVDKARLTMSATAFTTPAPDSDLDDFIRSFGSDCKTAWEAVQTLVAERIAHYRDYQGLADEIFATRQKKDRYDKRRDFEINSQVTDIIKVDLYNRGIFYHDGREAYFFFQGDKKLIAIHPDDMECTLMLSRYSINRVETIFRYLVESLRVEAFEHGTRTDVFRLARYNPETFTVYLFNHQNQIYRIAPEIIELVDNGTDGVLFLADAKAQPFDVEEPDESHSWFDTVIVSKINYASDILTPNERKLIFTFWFLALFFESIMPTKPILAFIGPKGSGKSMTNRKIGILLFGETFDVTPLTDDPRDFDAAVTNAAFVAIDNADRKCDWLNDRLAIVATGGSIKRRAYYTTNTLVEYPVLCFLAITSRTPHFRRDDVADRLLIMNVKRFDTFTSENALLAEVIQHRDLIMSEAVYKLQEVVQALRDGKDADDSGGFRMADFADFAMKVARYTGVAEEVKAIFSKLAREQSSFTLEHEPIFELLCIWATNNADREITNADLCDELAKLADTQEIAFHYKGQTKAFAQRMTHLRANMAEFFTITERQAGGRKRFFTFTPKPEEYDT